MARPAPGEPVELWLRSGARRDHIPGQWCEPLRPGAGAVCEDVVLVVVAALDGAVVVLEVAALGIAARQPPTAAVTASAVSKGLIFEGICSPPLVALSTRWAMLV